MTETQQTQLPQPQSLPVAAVSRGNGLGTASLIIGIVAFIGAFIPFINFGSGLLAAVGLIFGSGLLAAVGLIFGIVALTRKGKAKGTALAGLITSAIAIVLSIILALVYTAGFITAVDESLPKSVTKDSTVSAPDAAAAAEDSAAEPVAAEIGTRDNPAPIGTVIETTSGGAVDYEVTLGAPTLDANQLVAGENQFNAAAPAGLQFAMIPISFTYKGTETGTPWIDMQIEFVSAAGTTHTSSDVLAVGPAPTLTDVNELYPGAAGTANVIIAIPSADVENGNWVVSSLFGGDKYFFAAQ